MTEWHMVNGELVEAVDRHLDAGVSRPYQLQPLAQDWARVSKLAEETGEAIAELISWTGQNPRKPLDPAAGDRMLRELADAALTGIYALQHFTKDIERTALIMAEQQDKHLRRLEALRDSREPE